jgi:hypothetical protein
MCCSGCRLDPCGKRGAGRSDAISSNGINHGHSSVPDRCHFRRPASSNLPLETHQ